MKTTLRNFLVALVLTAASRPSAFAYQAVNHTNITQKALNNWAAATILCPYHPTVNCMNTGTRPNDILWGAVHEDDGSNWLWHFWNEDGGTNDGYLGYDSALTRAQTLADESQAAWDAKPRDETTAYRRLGQVIHMIQDMGVPAHCLLDPHPPWNPDTYEAHYCPTNAALFASTATARPADGEANWLQLLMEPLCDSTDNFDSNDRNGEVDAGTRRAGGITNAEALVIGNACYTSAIRDSFGPMWRFHQKNHKNLDFFAGDPVFIQKDRRVDASVLHWLQNVSETEGN